MPDFRPGHQLGFVRLWKARAVDVRLLWGAIAPLEREDSDLETANTENNFQNPDDLARRLALALQPPPELWMREAGALDCASGLFPFQKEGIGALLSSPQLLLADEMGLGKSVQAIGALRILLHRREIERALVVVPASLVEQWKREWHKWASEIVVLPIGGRASERKWQWRYRAHVTLVSYETLRADAQLKRGPLAQNWGAVVLDEAQKIKNAESEIAVTCKKLPRVRSFALSGTPLENHADDLSSILEFLVGRRLGGFNLRSTLQSVQLRRRKSEVLAQLPPKITTDLTIELSPRQKRAYESAERDGLFALRSGPISIENVLALLTRLKQICNFDPQSGESAKVEDLRPRLAEIVEAGQKALIFTQFSGESGAARLAKSLREFTPLVYTGDLTMPQRTRLLDRFAEEPGAQVLILSLKAGGAGLNLQSASYVFHFDRWWNPAIEAQAEARAHRMGQENPVNVYRYVTPNTIEARIGEVLSDKAALFEDWIEGAMLESAFSREQLFKIAGL